jgi:soluble lytic murein transglycosylase
MQLLPVTAERAARELSLEHHPDRLIQVQYNLELGAFYLSKLLHEFDQQVVFTLASYNAGPKAVASWFQSGGELPLDLWVARIPFSETRRYVQHVVTNWVRYRYLTRGEHRLPRLALDLPKSLRISPHVY